MSDEKKMTLAGEVVRIDGPILVGAKGTQKTLVLVRTPGQYPQDIPVEFWGDRAESVARQIAPGDEVEIGIDLRGREWQGRHYVSVQGWRVALTGAGTGEQAGDGADAHHAPPSDPQGNIPF
jgi:single-stranded DNA-binding protein